MRRGVSLFMLLLFCLGLSGCGETVRGACRDAKRIGEGVKHIFVGQ
jgi:predicted small secreted protein